MICYSPALTHKFYTGCTEKGDYVELVERLMPKHDPEAHKKRKQEL